MGPDTQTRESKPADEIIDPDDANASAARRRTILGRPRFAGAVGAVAFGWASFLPTMMPRTVQAQAMITGLCLAAGYGLFTLAAWPVHTAFRRRAVHVTARSRAAAWIALEVSAGFVLVVGGVWMWARWQNQQRTMLGMDGLAAWTALPMLVGALAVGALLVVIGRSIGRGIVALHRWVSRGLGPGRAGVVTTVAVIALVAFLLSSFFVNQFSNWANSAFATVDDGTEDGIEPPASPAVSGSPASLAAWDTLGFQGRTFVATATPTDVIADFHDADLDDVLEPIRVYTGIRTADDLEERAAIAVDELDRTGGFDRDVLAVVTTTGTGWVDPDAAEALEVLHAGNTAIVAMQYSYLPSWIASLIDKPASADAGAALFDAVYDRWASMPETGRPELIVFGLSLGSYGAEAAFAGESASNSLRNLTARADGALLGERGVATGHRRTRRRVAGVAARVRRRTNGAFCQQRRRARRHRFDLGRATRAVRAARIRSGDVLERRLVLPTTRVEGHTTRARCSGRWAVDPRRHGNPGGLRSHGRVRRAARPRARLPIGVARRLGPGDPARRLDIDRHRSALRLPRGAASWPRR
jgi:uncharacterized membrane protein